MYESINHRIDARHCNNVQSVLSSFLVLRVCGKRGDARITREQGKRGSDGQQATGAHALNNYDAGPITLPAVRKSHGSPKDLGSNLTHLPSYFPSIPAITVFTCKSMGVALRCQAHAALKYAMLIGGGGGSEPFTAAG